MPPHSFCELDHYHHHHHHHHHQFLSELQQHQRLWRGGHKHSVRHTQPPLSAKPPATESWRPHQRGLSMAKTESFSALHPTPWPHSDPVRGLQPSSFVLLCLLACM